MLEILETIGSAILNIIGGAVLIGLALICVVAWITHLVTCFTLGLWGFLIAGAIFFPIGVAHGVWLWL